MAWNSLESYRASETCLGKQRLRHDACTWVMRERSLFGLGKQSTSIKPNRIPLRTFNNQRLETHTSTPNMILAVLLLGLLAIALNAYFLPQNGRSSRRIREGATGQVLQPEEGDEGGDTKTRIPISVNYHFTRQCNYSCRSSHPSLIPPVCFDWDTF